MKITGTRGATALALVTLVSVVSACGLPRSGPNKAEIFKGSVLKEGDAFIVSVNSRVTRATAVTPSLGFSSDFMKAGVLGSDVISPGDTLGLTIFENVKDDPLLGNTGQRVSALQQIQVDGAGYIFVPYAGRVKAAGQSPEGLRNVLTEKARHANPRSADLGRAAGGRRLDRLDLGLCRGAGYHSDRTADPHACGMLAKAGGVTIEPEVAIIRVTRGNKTGQVWLQDLNQNPGLDIALRPGDKIFVDRDTRAFTALGATGSQNRVPFTSQTLSAIEAIATVGGLEHRHGRPDRRLCLPQRTGGDCQ